MWGADAAAGPAGFPLIVDPNVETVSPVEETAGLGPVTLEPEYLIVISDCIDNSTADLVTVELDDDPLANQGLPFSLQVKCHPAPFPS
jgi:hypothetical protein